MKFVSNMKITGKLQLLVFPLIVALIVVVVVYATQTISINAQLKEALYDEAFVSTASIINADRDFYQAAIAENELYFSAFTINDEQEEALCVAYEENASQVYDRIRSGLDNVADNEYLYRVKVLPDSGLTLEQLEKEFFVSFATWKAAYDPRTHLGSFEYKLTVFNDTRLFIDQMTQLLEDYVNSRSAEITAEINSSIFLVVTVVSLLLLLLIILAAYVMKSVSSSIRFVTDLSSHIAKGDLSIKVDKHRLTKDEIGILTSIIDRDVRQAFMSVEESRVISEQRAVEQDKAHLLSLKRTQYQIEQIDKLLINLQRLAKGDLVCDMEVARGDQDTNDIYDIFSEISSNMHASFSAIKSYVAEVAEILGKLSEGDLTVEIKSEYLGDFVTLKDSINKIVDDLNMVFAEIAIAAAQVTSGTQQVANGSQEISHGATEQASAIEQLTASLSEISAQTRANAMNADEANQFSLNAQSAAIDGNEQMKKMQTAMTDINKSSESISKIIKVIDDIAFQTNILALNAAVEAARAGAHGRGFAVVAEEVRNLAARSANAAKETTDLIESSIISVQAGTKIADGTANALANIVDSVQKEVLLVGKIAKASNEQSTGIVQINQGIEQLSHVVQSNSAVAEEAAATSEELNGQAELLKSMIEKFKLQ